MRHMLIVVLCAGLAAPAAYACSPGPGWKPPTPETVFHDADVVIHAEVLSQTTDRGRAVGKIRVLQTLKGGFSDDEVQTADSAACGIGTFTVGKDYVLFFRGTSRFVNHLIQPWGVTPQQTLEVLQQIKK